jgi:hypothetical protein
VKQGGSQSKLSSLGTTPTDSNLYPSKIQLGSTSGAVDFAHELAIVEEILKVEIELMANTTSKELFLKSSKCSIADRIIAFKFGMDDREADAREVADNAKAVQESLDTCNLQLLEVEKTVSLLEYMLIMGASVQSCLLFFLIFPANF